MDRALRILVSAAIGMVLGLTVGFLLVPDPTGLAALFAGPALGLVFTGAIYLKIGAEDESGATA